MGFPTRVLPVGPYSVTTGVMLVKAHQASDYLTTPEDVAAYLNAAIEERLSPVCRISEA